MYNRKQNYFQKKIQYKIINENFFFTRFLTCNFRLITSFCQMTKKIEFKQVRFFLKQSIIFLQSFKVPNSQN